MILVIKLGTLSYLEDVIGASSNNFRVLLATSLLSFNLACLVLAADAILEACDSFSLF